MKVLQHRVLEERIFLDRQIMRQEVEDGSTAITIVNQCLSDYATLSV
jgi:hypothetical protein